MNAVHDQAISGLPRSFPLDASSDLAWWRVRLSHVFWRLKIGWLPKAASAVLTVFALGIASQIDLNNDWLDALKYVGAFMPFVITIFLAGLINSKDCGAIYRTRSGPLGPLTCRYENMIDEIDRPVAVVIDDLDRCDAAFVVELLQTVQTLFRRARVLYVVAADRGWLCTSYEKIYEDFSDAVAEPGRSLGHLFVEKVFQVSLEVPPLLDHQRDSFWNALIGRTDEQSSNEEERIEAEIAGVIDELDTEIELIKFVQSQRTDAQRASIAGAQAFRRMQSAPLKKEREHFLSRYSALLEPNPRAMKRLLNAYGFRRGYDIQALTPSDPDALARWTILENRWPILTDHLSSSGGSETSDTIKQLMRDDEVLRVADGLTWSALRPVPGGPGPELVSPGENA